MPVVEVPCPGCGAKLKAPDNMAGKKAKCKKCGQTFRIPASGVAAGVPLTSSVADGDKNEVMMAEPVDVPMALPVSSDPEPVATPKPAAPKPPPIPVAKEPPKQAPEPAP